MSDNKSSYQRTIFLLLLALLLMTFISFLIGPTGIFMVKAIMGFRLSRIILAIIAGSSLAASGASLQAIFKNPLADPHLFGISGGASLGACIAIACYAKGQMIMPSTGAILGGFLAFLILLFYLNKSPSIPNNCLLVGILVNSIASSLIIMLKIALPAHKSQSLLFWLVGHVGAVARSDFFLIIPLWLLGLTLLIRVKGELEVLSFGFDEAKLVGIDPERITKIAIIANCILIGNVVAYAGMIGFLGLLVPHLVRILFCSNLKVMLS